MSPWKVIVHALAVIVFAAANDISSAQANIATEAEKQECQTDLNRIASMVKALKPGMANDLVAYEEFADGVLAKWMPRNKECRARVVLHIVWPLSSGQFADRRQYDLARTYALSALAEPNEITLETEIRLIGHVMTHTRGGPEGEEYARQRKRNTEVRLHAWKRVIDTIDPNWDPNDLPYLNVPLPPGVFGTSGMDPKSIKDPKQRAAYEQAIERNNLKTQKFHEQNRARRWLKRFPQEAEEYIIQMYSKPPYNPEELSILLKQFVADERTRTRILDTVDKNMRTPPSSDGSSAQTSLPNSRDGQPSDSRHKR